MNKNKKIAIIGAGPGGLTLASILQKNGFQPVIYEREQTSVHSLQGGSLDIHTDTGQWALKEAGLLEQFQTLARYEGEDFRLLDKTGKIYLDEIADVNEGERPEIDRSQLCQILLDSVDEASIRWGYQLSHAVPAVDDQYELHFENGAIDIVDLVVAADGAFSHVRPLLTESQAAYSGLTMIELNLEHISTAHPEILAFNRRGKLFALADHKAIIAQLNGDDSLRLYLSFQTDQNWLKTCGISFDQPDKAKDQLLHLFDDWNEQLKDYIRAAVGPIRPRRIYMLPIGLTWEHKHGVTMIGDAAHLMSPFAGEGVNLAMQDAANLAISLIQATNMNKAIQQYEQDMFTYSAQSAYISDQSLQICFGDHAAAALANWMSQEFAHSENEPNKKER